MKKSYKWIVGSLIVLAIVAALVAVPFAMRNYMFVANGTNSLPQEQTWNRWPMMDGNQNWQHPAVPGYPRGFDNRSSGQRNFGFNDRFSPFGMGFMFLGGLLRLIPLALFALLLYGVYQLGRRSALRTLSSAVSTPSQPPAPAEPTPEESENPIE